ncbi:MAG TPA: LysR family transcriptional regulator, partial [Beijerinckia sp.]|nr:LysR family transcriptional regulator [Beijerinckia sp.]
MQKLDDLITFVRVVERGSFVAAARQLGVPPATVSRKIQDLEHRLGIELLRRTTRRVFVTDAGREVYDRAAQGLMLIDEAELVARNHSAKPAGVLRVLAPYALGTLVVGEILPSF